MNVQLKECVEDYVILMNKEKRTNKENYDLSLLSEYLREVMTVSELNEYIQKITEV